MGRHQGMADAGRDEVRTRVLAAWDSFIGQAEGIDLERPSRLPGWRAHEICVHLGCWDDHAAMADLVASARTGATGAQPDPDAVNARITAAHAAASREEVLAALHRNREATARYLAEAPVELDTAPTVSVVGRLPLLSVVLGQAYELAVHGLDLVSCGAEPPPADVLQSGLAALVDVTGALATSCGITGRVTLATPDGGWSFDADPEGWRVSPVPAGAHEGPAVEGSAELLLEAASGRINPVPAAARRQLRVHDVGGLLQLAPIVQKVPGIPGGPILQLAARTMGGPAAALGRLFRRG
ncbi:maleylpyruvate isomerase family mycothiol-dependent enzyme [Blastococcus sp. TML/M2B]|uniref:maleylpyruvate isomerase N-terminal domain-containing protein n=1 Tax=unclassified Blastococcus TaxID=2619396 RepID=UPI00190E0CB6|nr:MULTISPECIES: maleylpyruvate isomerase N-terminal domain-containing protein [unclassified Blastococcus]MBN1092231.1 maleylpyruvate isomerase family mycothiol-dependent enzyme [Blastococcus sp. TML/M2B]MBN1097666.1 maleylpyruvate isomerase family mycothiol-dependent enzyme [Blastococcus sp. TML/C7B]